MGGQILKVYLGKKIGQDLETDYYLSALRALSGFLVRVTIYMVEGKSKVENYGGEKNDLVGGDTICT